MRPQHASGAPEMAELARDGKAKHTPGTDAVLGVPVQYLIRTSRLIAVPVMKPDG